MNKLSLFAAHVAIALSGTVLSTAACAADNYPAKPIRMVVAFPPGGPADIVARIVGQGLEKILRQSIVIENRGGAGGNIGAQIVAKSEPDGYTMLVTTTSFAVNPSLYANSGYNAEKDFVTVSVIASQPNIIAVHQTVPVNTLAELQALVSKEKMAYASPGAGTTPHLTGEHLFRISWRSETTHVPFRGAGPAVAGVLTGQPPIASTALAAVLPHHKSGKLKILAVASEKRLEALPDVPTLSELGYPKIQDYTWVAVLAPTGTPEAYVNRINEAINQVIATPAYKARLDEQALTPVGGSAMQAGDYMKLELQRWRQIVRDTDVKVD